MKVLANGAFASVQPPRKFGADLTHAMREAGLSNTQVGAAIGVSANTVVKWRYDLRSPGSRNLVALVRLLPAFGKAIGLIAADVP